MEAGNPKYERYVFVCENERENLPCCMPGGMKIREKLKERVKEMGLSTRIRVSRSGCLDACTEGPNVLVMPDGVSFRHVGVEDLDRILDVLKKGVCG